MHVLLGSRNGLYLLSGLLSGLFLGGLFLLVSAQQFIGLFQGIRGPFPGLLQFFEVIDIGERLAASRSRLEDLEALAVRLDAVQDRDVSADRQRVEHEVDESPQDQGSRQQYQRPGE